MIVTARHVLLRGVNHDHLLFGHLADGVTGAFLAEDAVFETAIRQEVGPPLSPPVDVQVAGIDRITRAPSTSVVSAVSTSTADPRGTVSMTVPSNRFVMSIICDRSCQVPLTNFCMNSSLVDAVAVPKASSLQLNSLDA